MDAFHLRRDFPVGDVESLRPDTRPVLRVLGSTAEKGSGSWLLRYRNREHVERLSPLGSLTAVCGSVIEC